MSAQTGAQVLVLSPPQPALYGRLCSRGSPRPFVCSTSLPHSTMHNAATKMLTVPNKNQQGAPTNQGSLGAHLILHALLGGAGGNALQLIVAFQRRSPAFFFPPHSSGVLQAPRSAPLPTAAAVFQLLRQTFPHFVPITIVIWASYE